MARSIFSDVLSPENNNFLFSNSTQIIIDALFVSDVSDLYSSTASSILPKNESDACSCILFLFSIFSATFKTSFSVGAITLITPSQKLYSFPSKIGYSIEIPFSSIKETKPDTLFGECSCILEYTLVPLPFIQTLSIIFLPSSCRYRIHPLIWSSSICEKINKSILSLFPAILSIKFLKPAANVEGPASITIFTLFSATQRSQIQSPWQAFCTSISTISATPLSHIFAYLTDLLLNRFIL